MISSRKNYYRICKKIKTTEYNIYLYENIIKIVSIKNNNGIPRKIINHKLLLIENSVNNILNKFLDKKIYITKEIDDIKVIIIDQKSNKVPFGGGMESFMMMLACKVAFTQIFNISHPNILFIDEGVSVLDRDHITNFNVISEFMKTYYNHIILITHIDSFFDYTVDNININKKMVKDNETSYVYY